MNLKIGGSNVGKIMYGGQEFGGAAKLEPGTILYLSMPNQGDLKNVHLLSTTKKWENLNGINIAVYYSGLTSKPIDIDISGDDFKNLDIGKEFQVVDKSITVSRSIVDGEYRLNFLKQGLFVLCIIRAI